MLHLCSGNEYKENSGVSPVLTMNMRQKLDILNNLNFGSLR